MELLVIWTVCAIVCAVIAHSKNRSVAGWFFGGFLFGFFAVMAIALIKTLPVHVPDTAQGSAAASVIPEVKACPFCRETIHKDALLCKHCGSKLVD